MKLLVALEQRFMRTPSGAIFSPGARGLNFWQRYLEFFDQVEVLARVRDEPVLPEGAERSDGEKVHFHCLPHFVGPWQYMRQRGRVREVVRAALDDAEAILLRVPGTAATEVWRQARKQARPFGVDVVGDPWDALSPQVTRFFGQTLIRRRARSMMRVQCREACAATYVTAKFLQSGYPAGAGAFETYFSDIELPQDLLLDPPRSYTSPAHNLVTVGSLEIWYKGYQYLLPAFKACLAKNPGLRLTIVGGGRIQAEVEAIARQLGIAEQVSFPGRLRPASAVYEQLDDADLFVFPSLQEGLPRALVEAMARGLPCVSTAVGGIGELLASEDLVPPADVPALTAKLNEVVSDPERLMRMSARNAKTAAQYESSLLAARRPPFYQELRSRTEAWLRKRRGR